MLGVASNLVREGLRNSKEIVARAEKDLSGLRVVFTKQSGVGQAAFNYCLMLLGVEGIKADVWITRFMADDRLGPSEVERILMEVAERLNVQPIHLDHTIWRFESGRWQPG